MTPFADRARDRALQTLYIMLCRYWIDDLRGNTAAKNYKKDDPRLNQVREYILDCVNKVDAQEYENVKKELEKIEEEWEARCCPNLVYKKNSEYAKDQISLFDPESDENGRFRIMNSMRSVETTVNITIEE